MASCLEWDRAQSLLIAHDLRDDPCLARVGAMGNLAEVGLSGQAPFSLPHPWGVRVGVRVGCWGSRHLFEAEGIRASWANFWGMPQIAPFYRLLGCLGSKGPEKSPSGSVRTVATRSRDGVLKSDAGDLMARHWSRVHLRLRTTHDRGSGRGAQCPECPAKIVATLSLSQCRHSTLSIQRQCRADGTVPRPSPRKELL